MKQVYITEDSPTQLLRVKRILSEVPDLELTTFSDGLQSYEAVRRKPPDLLMMDLILPSLHGLAVCRLLKFHEDYRDIPVLIFSSVTEANIQDQVRAVRGNAYLRKPFSAEDLLSEVRRLLGE
jgi:CheY-like chemotaxis protein